MKICEVYSGRFNLLLGYQSGISDIFVGNFGIEWKKGSNNFLLWLARITEYNQLALVHNAYLPFFTFTYDLKRFRDFII